MLVVTGLSGLVAQVHVEQTLGFRLVDLLGQGDLRSQNGAGLGEHTLLPRGQAVLVDIALGEIANHFGDLVDIAGGDLFDVQLVTARPVHLFLDDRGPQDVEHLGHFGCGDDVTHTDLLGIVHGNVDDQTIGREYGQLQIFARHSLDRPLGNGLHLRCTMTRIDDHIADFVRHVPSEN